MHRPDEAHAFWLRCWFALVFITVPGTRELRARPAKSAAAPTNRAHVTIASIPCAHKTIGSFSSLTPPPGRDLDIKQTVTFALF
jgi:hypothetical protein